MKTYTFELERTVLVRQRADVTVQAPGEGEAYDLACEQAEWKQLRVLDSHGVNLVGMSSSVAPEAPAVQPEAAPAMPYTPPPSPAPGHTPAPAEPKQA